MTRAAQLLSRVTALGVALHAEGGRLRFRAAKGVMTPELVSELKSDETELIAYLEAHPAAGIPRDSAEQHGELSHAQRRLWVLHELDRATPTYHIPLVHLLEGALDVDALRTAFDWLVRRHQALRTAIRSERGVPGQHVTALIGPVMTYSDASNRPDPATAARADVRALIARPFDLAQGPLLRVALIRIADRQHLLAIVLHHIIADGGSIAVLLRELNESYTAVREGRGFDLPSPSVQYRDYAAWQNRYIEGPDAEAHREYWLNKLAPPLARAELLPDVPRSSRASAEGAEESFVIDRETVRGLQRLCRERGATLFMGLVAVVKALIHRYTGSEDVVVGTPVAGRDHPDLSSVVGLFINTLVLRDAVDSEMTFDALLSSVRRTCVEALDHAVYPFDRLVQDLDAARDAARSPVFDVMVILQNQQTDRFSLDGVTAAPLYEHTGTSKFDLTLNFHELDGEVSLGIEYRTSLFGRERIRRLGSHFETLMRGAVQSPRQPIGGIEIVSSDERRRLLRDWNRTARPFPLGRTVVDLFDTQVRAHADRTAVTCGDVSLTCGELDARATWIARHLRRRGAEPGVVVGLCLDRSVDLLATLIAIVRCGAAYTPLDPLYPIDRLLRQLRDSGACLLVTDRSLADRLPPDVPPVVLVDSLVDDRAPTPRLPGATPAAAAYVIYTSGSTGGPKGVQVTHRNLANLLLAMEECPGLAASDVLVAVTSLSFDIAGLELFLPTIAGAHVVIATSEEARDGGRLRHLLETSGATVMQGTPATWRMLIAAGWGGTPAFKILCGGELLPDDLADELIDRAAEVWNLYGPTETSIWSLVHRVAPRAERRDPHAGVSIGRPIGNTTAYILDRRGEPVPVGCAADLYLGGVGVADGYLHRSDLTAEKFVPDPFGGDGRRIYRTGDRAVYLEDGRIQFLGRDDHQVKVRGFRVELGEIEAALRQHDCVGDAVVIAAGDQSDDRPLVAYVVPSPGADIDAPMLRAQLALTLPPQAVPSLIVRLERLPLTPNGKVDRRALPQPDRRSAGVTQTLVLPRDARERAIRDLWASVLDLDEIGVYDNFFQLGGHSLRATRLTYLLQSSLGIDASLIDVFKAPTIAGMAERLRGRGPADPIGVQPVTPAAARARDRSQPIAPMTPEEVQLLGDL